MGIKRELLLMPRMIAFISLILPLKVILVESIATWVLFIVDLLKWDDTIRITRANWMLSLRSMHTQTLTIKRESLFFTTAQLQTLQHSSMKWNSIAFQLQSLKIWKLLQIHSSSQPLYPGSLIKVTTSKLHSKMLLRKSCSELTELHLWNWTTPKPYILSKTLENS